MATLKPAAATKVSFLLCRISGVDQQCLTGVSPAFACHTYTTWTWCVTAPEQAPGDRDVLLTEPGTCRNALLMNALSTPSHLPSRQPSASRNSSEIQAEEDQRSARLEALQQQVPDSPQPFCSSAVAASEC